MRGSPAYPNDGHASHEKSQGEWRRPQREARSSVSRPRIPRTWAQGRVRKDGSKLTVVNLWAVELWGIRSLFVFHFVYLHDDCFFCNELTGHLWCDKWTCLRTSKNYIHIWLFSNDILFVSTAEGTQYWGKGSMLNGLSMCMSWLMAYWTSLW